MDDRELIELAARAAGIEVAFSTDGECVQIHAPGHFTDWNPLTDNSDAFELAVDLKMGIYIFGGDDARTEAWTGEGANFCDEAPRHHNGDPYAATRRAITRAAAAFGKGMGDE